MATHNITIDQNNDTNVTITDANALSADKIIMSFYQNGINIFNLATVNMGGVAGEITINNGVSYVAAVTAELALKLNSADTITHKIWQFDSVDTATALHTGSVTVTPLSGSDPGQSTLQYSNDRMYDRTLTGATETLRYTDQVVYCIQAIGMLITLPDATTIPGKEFFIKNLGSASIEFDYNDGTLTLDTGEVAWIRARGTSETTPEGDYIVLYTSGVTA